MEAVDGSSAAGKENVPGNQMEVEGDAMDWGNDDEAEKRARYVAWT